MVFKPGQSGNPAGRKRGAKNKLRFPKLQEAGPEIVQKAIDEALKGDPSALRLCIERLIPRLRPQAALINVEAASSKIVDIGESIVNAALSGKISPDSARDILSALSDVAKLREVTELEERVEVLEKLKGTPPWEQESSKPKLPMRGKRKRRESCDETSIKD